MKRITNPVHAFFPCTALILLLILSLRADVSLRPVWIGAILLTFIQWLFNMNATPDTSQTSKDKDIEAKAAEQFNDPEFAKIVTHSTQNGVTFLPTRGFHVSDSYRTMFASWLILGFTSLATIISIEDRVNPAGKVRLFPYKWVFICLIVIFLLEMITDRLRHKK